MWFNKNDQIYSKAIMPDWGRVQAHQGLHREHLISFLPHFCEAQTLTLILQVRKLRLKGSSNLPEVTQLCK